MSLLCDRPKEYLVLIYSNGQMSYFGNFSFTNINRLLDILYTTMSSSDIFKETI